MARDFNGSTQYISLGDIAGWGGQSALTLSIWANPDTLIDYQSIFYQSDSGTASIGMIAGGSFDGTSNDVIATVRNGDQRYASSTDDSFTSGTWHHLAMVYDGAGSTDADKVKLYIDGSLKTLTMYQSGAFPATTPNLSGNVNIGATNGGATFFDGKLAEAASWQAALTQSHITSLSAGLSPMLVRPDALIQYNPLRIGDASADWWQQNNGTESNTPGDSQHPPVIYPNGLLTVNQAAAGGGGGGTVIPVFMNQYRQRWS